MGLLREKYTAEYFTGKDKDGNDLKYGATCYKDENGDYILRDQDKYIVEKVNFSSKRVLEFGFGRGEVARYAIEHNVEHYEGVDFSDAAIKIALEVTKNCIIKPIFHNQDALDFIMRISHSTEKKFDIVIMFDFVEHIPRDELREIFYQMSNVISADALIVINTPAYKYDNDVIKYGLDNRNNENSIDTSDLIKETSGMHCNKYSVVSLQKFMKECGFINISETHFYIREREEFSKSLYKSYYDTWTKCLNLGYSILGTYDDDLIEYAYVRDIQPVWSRFDCGEMKGFELLCTESYKNSIYSSGEYDYEMFIDFRENHGNAKVVFDVGGFVGVTSLIFAKCMNNRGRVISFEPNPWNLNRILLNLSHNPEISKGIFTMQNALGEKDNIQNMLMSENIDQGYSSTSRIESSHAKIADDMLPNGFFEENVLVRTMDSIVDQTGIIPDVIKVDIEGSEHLFLIGAQETLKRYKPILYIEFHSEFCAFKCTELLIGFGYMIQVLHEEDDNRLMIKAYPDDKGITDINLMGMSINSLTSSMNIQKISLNLLNKCKVIIADKMTREKNEAFRQNDILKKHISEIEKQMYELEKKGDERQKYEDGLEKHADELQCHVNELEKHAVELQCHVNELEKHAVELKCYVNELEKHSDELHKIYASHGWEVLKMLYKIKSKLFHK